MWIQCICLDPVCIPYTVDAIQYMEYALSMQYIAINLLEALRYLYAMHKRC